MSSFVWVFECKLYHQHLGYGADAEDIHGDADLHGRTCNQQNHPALVAVIIRRSLINRCLDLSGTGISRLYLDNNNNSSYNESLFTFDSRARYNLDTFAMTFLSTEFKSLIRLTRERANRSSLFFRWPSLWLNWETRIVLAREDCLSGNVRNIGSTRVSQKQSNKRTSRGELTPCTEPNQQDSSSATLPSKARRIIHTCFVT